MSDNLTDLSDERVVAELPWRLEPLKLYNATRREGMEYRLNFTTLEQIRTANNRTP
jgi:hypothetical protein